MEKHIFGTSAITKHALIVNEITASVDISNLDQSV